MKTKPTIATLKTYLPLAAVLGLLLIPRMGLAVSISCGQTVENTTTSASQIDQYSYAGSAGQVLSFALFGYTGTTSASMEADVYSPGGQLLTSVSVNGNANGGYGDGEAVNLTLTSSGTFTILVHSSAYNHTGSYSLSVQSVTGGGCNSKSLTCGQSVSTNTSFNSEMDAYSYVGSAGQVVSFALWGYTGTTFASMEADVYSPSGQLLTSVSVGGNANGGYGGGEAVNLTLASSGTFTILVHSSPYIHTGSYSLSIQSVTSGGCNSTSLACGQSVSTNTSFNSEMDAYSYVGSAGQVVSFALWGYTGTTFASMEADVYSPSGQLLTSVSVGGNANGGYGGGGAVNLTLTNSGTFTILVHSSPYDHTGGYSLSIQSVTGGGCNSTSLTCGQSVRTNTSFNSEMDVYSYVGSAGQVLSFAFWGDTGTSFVSMETDVYSPSGQLLTSVSVNGNGNGGYGGGGAVNLTLTNSGTFTILVHSLPYDGTGSYSLSIQSVTGGGCNSTSLACGQSVRTNTSLQSEMDAYGFGTGGGTVIFSFSGYSGAQFDLYDPLGNKLFTATPGTAPNTNLAPGTYTLLVHDGSYAHTGNYNFTATCLGGCNYSISPTGPVSVGASATNGTVTVIAGSGCSWTATTNASWLRITSGSSGTGNGTVSYTVDANTTANARGGALTIVGTNGFTFIVNQANPVVFVGQDIGAPGAPGSFSYSNGTYTVSGSGEGTDGSADVFYFAYQTLAGDAQIMARLQSLQGGDPQLAEAGVMIRESLDPGSKQVSLTMNASTNVIFRRRLANNNFSFLNSFRGTNYLQGTNYVWLRLMRMGNTFVAHYSTNGLNWQYMGFTTMNMSNSVQVGLGVTAHHYGQLATAVFDNVSTGGLTPLSGVWPLLGPKFLLGGQNWSPAEIQRVGGFEFLLGGVVGEYDNIKATTNLATPYSLWPLLATVTNTYGVVPILDAGAVTNKMKYYRAQKIGP
jgi:hypothetical protein